MLTWIEISRQALAHNLGVLRNCAGSSVLIAPAVKGNAYGHGMVEAAKTALQNGADWLTVATVEDAEILRAAGVTAPLLLVGFSESGSAERVAKTKAITIVYARESARALSNAGAGQGISVPVHVKVDTGMGRQGILPEDALEFIRYLRSLSALNVEGVATHFATSDALRDDTLFMQQLDTFVRLKGVIEHVGFRIPYYHCANSAATLRYPESHFSLVRPGISLYGYYPSSDVAAWCLENHIVLSPSLTLKTRVAQVKVLPVGHCISYGCTFKTEKSTTIAVLPIGYADGIDRKLSNKGSVLIRGKRAPIVGRVCMNILMADVSHIPDVSVEDEVVIIGKQGDEEITVEEVAELVGTINYEITTRLRESIQRVYV